MAATGKDKRRTFLSDYAPAEDYLISPELTKGRPGLLPAQTPDGREVLIKCWPRTGKGDQTDLILIWRSEIRQLQRLAAIPRAEELFVPMLASGEDKEGFYLVLDPGQGTPLEHFRQGSAKRTILQQAHLPRSRRLIWSNVLRVAEALDLLHAQGVIHRNVDPWAIITTLGDQPDFRLTGFEWSMRLASLEGSVSGATTGRTAASFSHDWRNLGLLIGQLLGAPSERIVDLKILPSEIATHLTSAEGKLLRMMVGVDSIDRLEGQHICRRMEEVIAGIDAEVAGKETKLALALRLGTDSKLAEAIRRASGNEIEMDDISSQVQFVKDDLSVEPFLVRTEKQQTLLLGQRLSYTLSPYRQPGSTSAAEWEFAVCDRASFGRLPPAAFEGHVLLGPESLDLRTAQDAYRTFPLRRGKVARWDEKFALLKPQESQKTELDRKHQSFALLALLEMAYAAADIFPVEVLPGSADMRGELHVLRVAARNDAGRAALSTALKMQPPAIRLARMLEADEVSGDTGWVMSPTGALGDREKDSEWRFVERVEEHGRDVLRFEGPEQTQLSGNAFLAPAGMAGQIAQFRRRVKALKSLREHAELLRMLADPRRRIEKSHDPVVRDDRFKKLDGSKQQALTEILSTVPLFLLQGPPGVGKTFMVGDIVRRRFDDEPTTRLLLSAQSNAAIDHLMKEVQSVFLDVKPLMVRARPADDNTADTDLEIDRQASLHLKALAESDLLEECDSLIAKKVRALEKAASARDRTKKGPMAAEAKAFEAMILRAANLVFATTNSAAIESLIDERGYFDWSIIEEAGKATGGELVSPLLLSHRRLMIGDHKQLPPYGADRLEKLLLDANAVKAAVAAAKELISRQLREPAIEEMFDEVESEAIDYGRLCAETLQILNLFASLVDAELAPRTGKSARVPIARRLDEQHRMHPAIAQIVSACFYEGALQTNKEKAREYREGKAPLWSIDPDVLPNTPIVFIDMPFCREQYGYKGSDQGPAWSNRDEATAVIKALRLVMADKARAPALAVLSPYREQVKLLTRAIDEAKSAGLAHLGEFAPAVGDQLYCGTVDSFQGDQADCVVISMVRNNGHATAAKALGFLRDNRRMNVLLSRAKWKLIIVGSLRFYENVAELAQSLPEDEIGFLVKFMRALEAARKGRDASIVPWATLSGRRA